MDLGIRGKSALVTAASKGMGKATAMALAQEGVRILMCARTAADIKAAAEEVRAKTGVEVIDMVADVTKKDDVERLVKRAEEAFGGVDILVANAGGPPRGNLDEMSDEQWYGAFDTTVMFVVRLIRGVLPSMQRSSGRILTSVRVGEAPSRAPAVERRAPGHGGHGEDTVQELGPTTSHQRRVSRQILPDRLLGGAKQAGIHGTSSSRRPASTCRASVGPRGVRERHGVPRVGARPYVTGVALRDGGLIRSNV